MPHKLNEPHRDKIPKAKYRVTNWSEYDRGLVQRGDVRFWVDEAVIADWIVCVSIPEQKGATRRSKTGPLVGCERRALARVLPI